MLVFWFLPVLTNLIHLSFCGYRVCGPHFVGAVVFGAGINLIWKLFWAMWDNDSNIVGHYNRGGWWF